MLAAADGEVWWIGRNTLGGNAITIVGAGLCVYYYAHLDRFAKNLEPGDRVHAGDVIGAVGNTGDAAGLPTHLHFGIEKLSIFRARAVDPAPMLANAETRPFAILLGGTTEPPATNLHAGGREDLEMP